MSWVPLAAGLAVLAVAWLGPLPELARQAFWAHMTIHMGVVAVAAPLLALGLAGTRHDPARIAPGLTAPIPASIAELMIVWLWHAPVLHEAARLHAGMFALEQGSFLVAGLLLWSATIGGDVATRHWRPAQGVAALLFTSIHMTLLGSIFALTPRVLYAHAPIASQSLITSHSALSTAHGAALAPLVDQHLGGAIMLVVGGASYLSGALWLLTRMLASHTRPT